MTSVRLQVQLAQEVVDRLEAIAAERHIPVRYVLTQLIMGGGENAAPANKPKIPTAPTPNAPIVPIDPGVEPQRVSHLGAYHDLTEDQVMFLMRLEQLASYNDLNPKHPKYLSALAKQAWMRQWADEHGVRRDIDFNDIDWDDVMVDGSSRSDMGLKVVDNKRPRQDGKPRYCMRRDFPVEVDEDGTDRNGKDQVAIKLLAELDEHDRAEGWIV